MSPSVIGTGRRRLEGGDKVTGRTRFGGDLRLDGLCHVRLVLSPLPAARITAIDASEALALPGVLGVVSGPELERAGPLLARGRVRYAGEPVAAVVAEDPTTAADAALLVRVDYEPMPAVLDPFEAMRPDAPVVLGTGDVEDDDAEAHGVAGAAAADGGSPANVTATARGEKGSVEDAFSACAAVAEGRYFIPAVHQGFLEPHVSVVRAEPDDHYTVWTPTQAQFMTRRNVAADLGVPVTQVTVVPMPAGGAFGGKVRLFESLLGGLSRRFGRPMKLELTRTEEFLMGKGGPGCTIDVKLGADADGNLLALRAQAVFDNGAGPGGLCGVVIGSMSSTYRVPNYEVVGYDVATNKCPVAAYRAPGAVHAYFPLECAVEELAQRLDIDPLELRLRNASREGDPRHNQGTWPAIGLVECLEAARRHPLYTAPAAEGEGVGVAVGGWGGGLEAAAAGCLLDEDGTLVVHVGSMDISGTATGLAMIAAETMGVPLESVRVETGTTDDSPYAGIAGGSKITYTVGPAVQAAAADAKQQLLEIAADVLEAAPEDLEVVEGQVRVRGTSRAKAVAELARLGMTFSAKHAPVFGHGRSAIRQQSPMFTVHIARVRLDRETGDFSVTGYAAIQDVGRAINPAEIAGQIHGGVLQALGRVLGEQVHYDADGQLRTANFGDYALPSIDQAPMTEVELVEVPSPHGPFGARGVGEPPAIPGPAAVVNALAAAGGGRQTQLPVDLSVLIGR